MSTPPRGARAGADRWLVSYADLMTLLFAFSMTLFAAAPPEPTAPPPLVSAMAQVFPPAEPPRSDVDPEPLATEAAVTSDGLYQRLARELADAIGTRRLELIRDPRGLVVSMPDDAAFPTGSAAATADARRLIERVGDTLRAVPNAIRIEGHTDTVPIRTAKYGSNWELSTARASAVVAFLVEHVGIDAARLSAAGYGEFHPLNPNDTAAQRARNRRVDLVILDTTAADLRHDRSSDARP